MSRFLKNRKLWLLAAGLILIAVLLFVKLWILAAIVLVGELLFLLSVIVVRDTQKPISELHHNRRVRQIDTLIIGDWCSRRQLARHFDLSRSLIVRAPGRSEKASLLLLEHLASRLDGKNVCIVQPVSDKGEIGPFDVPYMSQLTKLELGLSVSSRRMLLFLFFHPCELAKVLLSPLCSLRVSEPLTKEIQNYCVRKGFRLTCLKS